MPARIRKWVSALPRAVGLGNKVGEVVVVQSVGGCVAVSCGEKRRWEI